MLTMLVHPNRQTSIEMNNNIIIDQTVLHKFEQTAILRLIRKLDWRLLPFLLLIEIGSYVYRISTGHATLMGIESDLHLVQNEIELSVSLFFLAYLLFAIPSNILMWFIGPTSYLSLSMLGWGTLTIAMAFIKNAAHLLVIQVLLGITQAGFFPGMVIYFSLWYRKRDQTMRIALLVGAAILASALGSFLAYGFKNMDGTHGLHDWQWMFLIEGIPMIPLGVITYLLLSSVPNTVRWLDNCEKQLLTNILLDDAGIANRENVKLSWRQVLYVFIDVRIYLYSLIITGNLAVIKYINTYIPLLVEDMDSLQADSHLMSVPPYVLSLVCCLLASYSSSRKREYGFHIMFCLLVSLVGIILMMVLMNRSKTAVYMGLCIGCCGSFSAYPLILSWLTNNISGHTKRSMAVNFVIGIGQLGGIIMPFVCYGELTYQRDNYFCIGATIISLVFTIVLRICLLLENRRRDRLSAEKYALEAAVKDPCDWHPHFRYTL